MDTLRLEFVVKDRKGNALVTREIDYIDEYNLDKPNTRLRIARVASVAVEEAKNKILGTDLCCPECLSNAIRVLPYNLHPRGYCRACKHKATLRDFRAEARSAA